jgi:predicted permease
MSSLLFRLRALLRPTVVRAEFDDELRFHIEQETRANIARGLSADEARRIALAEFGGVERFKDGLRDERGLRWLDDLVADARHGMRLLRRNMLFSSAVVGTLALGIGATNTIFAIVNGVLLRTLPFANAEQVVSISEMRKGDDGGRIGQHAYTIWKDAARSFSGVAMYSSTSATLTGHGDPVDVRGAQATVDFFPVLGTRASLGRTFAPGEDKVGAPRVVVLSDVMWKNTFAADSAVIGRTITLNGTQATVVGVMPARFEMPGHSLFWVPLRVPSSPDAEFSFDMIARLRPGVAPATAQRELQSLVPRVDSLRSATWRGSQPVVMTLHDRLFGSVTTPLVLLLGAVVVLLLVACANVANLTLARSASRQREFAVRLALGAGRPRLVRQLLVESTLLAGIGGALGTLVPVLSLGAFVKLSPRSLAGVTDIHVDGPVLLVSLITTVVVSVLFGLVPALTGSRAALLAESRSGPTRAQRAWVSALVVFQVAAALTLLTAAGLFTKSFARVEAVAPGFEPRNLYAVNIALPGRRYPKSENAMAFYRTLRDRVVALRGVQSVSIGGSIPLAGYTYTKEMARSPENPARVAIAFAEVDDAYARTVGLHLVEGRTLDARDVLGAPPAAMLTASAARYFFPGESAIGRRLPSGGSPDGTKVAPIVVGVVDDMLQRSLDVPPTPQVFLSAAQQDEGWPFYLIVRTSMPEALLRSTVKRMVADIDPLQPLTGFNVLQDDLSESVAPRRFNAMLVNGFATLALILAMVGLYGLMANAVVARTRELGIRAALGAQSPALLTLVLRQGMVLALVGVAVGAASSLLLSRTVSSLLFNVPAQDPAVFVGAPLALAAVAWIACYIPARRATRVSPMTALRHE